MRINLPPVPAGPLAQTLQPAFSAITQAFMSVASNQEAVPQIFLSDANGQVWAVGITTTGAVTTTTVSGKVRAV